VKGVSPELGSNFSFASFKKNYWLGMVAHVCNLSYSEVEIRRFTVWEWPRKSVSKIPSSMISQECWSVLMIPAMQEA
jgi:hypothetical protein